MLCFFWGDFLGGPARDFKEFIFFGDHHVIQLGLRLGLGLGLLWWKEETCQNVSTGLNLWYLCV